MKPTEVRARLLEQHERLREMIELAAALAEQTRHGIADAGRQLQRAMVELASALARHNQDEEVLLGSILATVDAWGPVRRALMDEHHGAEHAALQNALDAAAEPGAAAADRTDEILARLLQHMDHEERHLLHASVLRDDCCTVDSFGG
jgi:hypothetical protein